MSQHDADDMSLNGDEIDNFEDDDLVIFMVVFYVSVGRDLGTVQNFSTKR